MSKLTTHILDTANGCPAANVTIKLYKLHGDHREFLTQSVTNSDGRCDAPLLEGTLMRAGLYELEFAMSEYFKHAGNKIAAIPFVGDVVLRFGLDNPAQHYHVPLLVSPWSYSTYRGS